MLITMLETSIDCLPFTDKRTDTKKVTKSERRGCGYTKREKVLRICLRVQHRIHKRRACHPLSLEKQRNRWEQTWVFEFTPTWCPPGAGLWIRMRNQDRKKSGKRVGRYGMGTIGSRTESCQVNCQ